MKSSMRLTALFVTLLMLTITGCLQPAETQDLSELTGQPAGAAMQEVAIAGTATSLAEETEEATPPEEVTQVVIPTQEATAEVTAVASPVVEATQEVVPTITEPASETPLAEATAFVLPTETPTLTLTPTATVTEIQIIPTETPTPTPTLTPAGEEVFPAQQPVPTEGNETPAVDVPAVAQNQEATAQAVPPLQQTATALIQEATDTAEALTATAIGPTVAPATDVPTQQVPVDTLTPTRQAQQPQQPSVSGADCVHQVRAGENLFRISLRYGVSIQDIAVASGIANPNLILVGQRLTIPGCGTTGAVPPPTDPATPAPGTGGTGGSVGGGGGGTVHIVQQYESLFEISMMYSVPISSIAAANGISNINLIIIGDELVIPAS